MKLVELTAKGRYYKVYRDGEYVSQHTTEREAIEAAQEQAFDDPVAVVFYRHEYEVDVALTNAGITVAGTAGQPADQPPTITSTPSPTFTEGVADTYDMTQHVSDDGLSTVTYSLSNTLPNGLSFNSTTGILTYDGIGVATVSQHQLTASDAVGSDQSASFDLTISETGTAATIALAVKRYDGGSGTATFNGVVHFQPGQLLEGGVSDLSIWNGATELPIYVNTLTGRHTDGSVKAVQVQTELSVPDSSPIGLTLRLGVTPSAGTVTPIDPDLTWARNQTLLYCTDAVHMCASRVMPLPLVAFSDPNMPAATVTFLTTGFDDWYAATTDAATAHYNWIYGQVCRYLCTGDPDALEATIRRCLDPTEKCYGGLNLDNYYMPDNAKAASCTVDGTSFTAFPSGNWVDAYDDYTGGADGRTNEPRSISADMFGIYYVTGSETARRVVLWHGATQYTFSIQNITPGGTVSNPRFSYRYRWLETFLPKLMGSTESIFNGSSATVPNPQTLDFSAKIQQMVDRADAWDVSDWRKGIWGSSQGINDVNNPCGAGTVEAFQYEVMLLPTLAYYNNEDADSRIGPAMQLLTEYVRDLITGPFTGGTPTEQYRMNYCERDPATIDQNEGFSDGSGAELGLVLMNIHSYIWKYAYDGDTDHRDVWDNIMRYPNPAMTLPNGRNEVKTLKLTGQVFSMAYHGAAWRAGAPALGY